MAVASAPYALAFTDPIEFTFSSRRTCKVQVRFYSDAEGTVPIAAGLGSRDVTATTTDYVVGIVGVEYVDEALDSDYLNGTQTLPGGTWAEFAFADGAIKASFAAAGGSDPPGAASYRIILSVDKKADR